MSSELHCGVASYTDPTSFPVQTRVRMMHSLAAIEQWAIDLALDVVCRFWNWRVGSADGKTGKRLPISFFADFLKVAEDEAKHFTLLRKVSW